jgi:hypothetical protein
MAKQASKPKEERDYFIVNPAGAIHSVSYEHAKARLALPGWRMATAEEVAKLKARGGNQVHNKPICQPWSPEPQEIELPDEVAEAQEGGGAGEKGK